VKVVAVAFAHPLTSSELRMDVDIGADMADDDDA